MHVILFALNGLLMIALPLVVATFLARRYRAEWGFFGAGAATFVAAQVLHIPFNNFVAGRYLPEVGAGVTVELFLVAAFYGLSAGIFEEVARYVTFRRWRTDARSWAEGLMVGAGHGGIEALILGLLFVVNMAVLFGVGRGYFRVLVPEGSVPAVQEQLAQLLALSWYESILGGVERAFAIAAHLALSLMVLRAARRKAIGWLLLAIGWHAAFNSVALIVAAVASPLVVEAVIGIFALVSLLLVYLWRDKETGETEHEAAEPARRPDLGMEVRDLGEKLDESRYLD